VEIVHQTSKSTDKSESEDDELAQKIFFDNVCCEV
jgi:hypothetical protein